MLPVPLVPDGRTIRQDLSAQPERVAPRPSYRLQTRLSGSTAGSSVVGIFPTKAIYRLVGAILLEQNDEWAEQRARYMMLGTIATGSWQRDPLRRAAHSHTAGFGASTSFACPHAEV